VSSRPGAAGGAADRDGFTLSWDSALQVAQTLGAVAALVAWVVVGGAVMWARLESAHVPNATRAVTLLPRDALVAEGLRALAIPLIIAVALALTLYLVLTLPVLNRALRFGIEGGRDRWQRAGAGDKLRNTLRRYVPIGVLGALAIALGVVLALDLDAFWIAMLIVLIAIEMAFGAMLVAKRPTPGAIALTAFVTAAIVGGTFQYLRQLPGPTRVVTVPGGSPVVPPADRRPRPPSGGAPRGRRLRVARDGTFLFRTRPFSVPVTGVVEIFTTRRVLARGWVRPRRVRLGTKAFHTADGFGALLRFHLSGYGRTRLARGPLLVAARITAIGAAGTQRTDSYPLSWCAGAPDDHTRGPVRTGPMATRWDNPGPARMCRRIAAAHLGLAVELEPARHGSHRARPRPRRAPPTLMTEAQRGSEAVAEPRAVALSHRGQERQRRRR
jgi:hypothetical protein